ncbi:MAG: 3-hydroxyacyl-CoA dehydrogenase NAD-binding domain-containing protein [Chloroflexota bacterium]
MSEINNITHIGIVGTGTIGGGWVAHFLRNGLQVQAWDPAADAEEKLRQRIANVWPVLERLELHPDASPENLTFGATLEEAVSGVHFVQESTPERLPTKVATLQEIDGACPLETIIANSTSGYLMNAMAVECQYPERCVVAHPFNPPYLIPLVEVVAGPQTSPKVHQDAVDFYRATGKQPLKLNKEVPGFVADRLMEAVWRESLHMINNDMATVEEIDTAMRYGPGPRWAMMGR